MTVQEMTKFLRLSVKVLDPDSGEVNKYYLSLTDDDIALFLSTAMSKDFPEYETLEDLQSEDTYMVILLAKKELYYSLAVNAASWYDIGADNNNYLKRDQIFQHFMKLAVQTDKEIQDYLDDGGGGGGLCSYDVRLANRYFTRYNYEHGTAPRISRLKVGEVTDVSIELSWGVALSTGFRHYKVYKSASPIVDEFALKGKILDGAELVYTITDVHQSLCRIEGLSSETGMYFAVEAEDKAGLRGYKEIYVSTAESEPQP